MLSVWQTDCKRSILDRKFIFFIGLSFRVKFLRDLDYKCNINLIKMIISNNAWHIVSPIFVIIELASEELINN